MRIERLVGQAVHQAESLVVIDVAGVGYGVDVVRTHGLVNIKLGDSLLVWVETILREDGVKLFGFATLEEKTCFNDLRSVSGVGPKTALTILESFGVNDIQEAVLERNQKLFESVSGIGKRLAERIVVELKPKFEKQVTVRSSAAPLKGSARVGAVSTGSSTEWSRDLRLALEQLDFHERDIQKVLQELRREQTDVELDFSALMKRALLMLRSERSDGNFKKL